MGSSVISPGRAGTRPAERPASSRPSAIQQLGERLGKQVTFAGRDEQRSALSGRRSQKKSLLGR